MGVFVFQQTATGPVTRQELTYVFDKGVLTGTNGVSSTSIDVPGITISFIT